MLGECLQDLLRAGCCERYPLPVAPVPVPFADATLNAWTCSTKIQIETCWDDLELCFDLIKVRSLNLSS